MRNLVLYLLVLFTLHSIAASGGGAATPSGADFIKASCRSTLYPTLCFQCLANYSATIQQSDHQLAQTALSVSLASARGTAMFVSRMTKFSGIKPREYQAVKDCVNNMGSTVAQLDQSIRELSNMGRVKGQDFEWHMSNVQTWVSSALTNENTCVDGFAGKYMEGNVKAAIKNRMITTAQITSNALALVNRFAVRHRAGKSTSMP